MKSWGERKFKSSVLFRPASGGRGSRPPYLWVGGMFAGLIENDGGGRGRLGRLGGCWRIARGGEDGVAKGGTCSGSCAGGLRRPTRHHLVYSPRGAENFPFSAAFVDCLLGSEIMPVSRR